MFFGETQLFKRFWIWTIWYLTNERPQLNWDTRLSIAACKPGGEVACVSSGVVLITLRSATWKSWWTEMLITKYFSD